jgi:hypothetical protein
MEKLLSLPHNPMAEELPLSQLVTPAFTIYAQHSLYLKEALSSIKYPWIWHASDNETQSALGWYTIVILHKIRTVHILFNHTITSHESTADQMLSNIIDEIFYEMWVNVVLMSPK